MATRCLLRCAVPAAKPYGEKDIERAEQGGQRRIEHRNSQIGGAFLVKRTGEICADFDWTVPASAGPIDGLE